LHARDPRAKIIALFGFLAIVATTPFGPPHPFIGYCLLLLGGILLARLPLGSVLLRAAIVLPFSLVFAAMSVAAGEAPRAGAMIAKSYLSALAVLVVAGTTPVSALLQGFERMGAPRFLLMVVQFLYRYIFVVSEQAQHMRMAASCRGLSRFSGNWRRRLRAAGGAIAVLFARSYARAEGIHQAMLARGYQGRLPVPGQSRFGWKDVVFLALALFISLALRIAPGVSHGWNR
jgi:cobalt/nickel transport system permease protein